MLVGENKEEGISKLILVEHALQLFPSLDNSVTIIAVDDKDDTLGILEIMSPQRSNLVLPTNIPDSELNILIFDGLDVKAYQKDNSVLVCYITDSLSMTSKFHMHTDCGNCCNDFTELQLV